MKKIYLVVHQRKPDTESIISHLVKQMKSAGLHPIGEAWLSSISAKIELEYAATPTGCDAVLSIGGDGTFLRATSMAISYDLPVLGVNLGTVGFLTEADWTQIETVCVALAEGRYAIEERMMLEASVGDRSFLALNDVVLHRGGYARLIRLNVSVGNEKVGSYISDGLVISSPTGSTGYSLSAGGPIVHPAVECMIMTPVCAHSLQHRPVVVAPSQTVHVSLDEDYNHTAQLDVDGQRSLLLDGSQELRITKAEKTARFIHLDTDVHPHGFFSTIRIKLAEWSH